MEPYQEDRSSLGRVIDRTVYLKLNHEKLKNLPRSKFLDKLLSTEQIAVKELCKSWGEHKALEEKEKFVHLYQIISGSDVIVPKLEVPSRDPVLEARVQKLKVKQAEREYQKMVSNITTQPTPQDETVAYQVKQLKSGLIGVVQLVVSIFAGFFFGFTGIPLILGQELDLGYKILSGITITLIIFIAELYFLVQRMWEEDSKSEEKKRQ